MHERRVRLVAAPPHVVWDRVDGIGGEQGWYGADTLWRARLLLDRALGGPGARGRPARPLQVGDPVDAWDVAEVEPGRRLALRSRFRLPGTAELTYEVLDVGRPGTTLLVQHLRWVPDGLAGRALWALELPGHVVVMRAMLDGLARAAERRARSAALD